MMSPLDYSEPATLQLYGQDRLVPRRTQFTTLAEAIRIVVEDVVAEPLADVFIATSQGAIQGIESARAIYLREDFPLPRSAGKPS